MSAKRLDRPAEDRVRGIEEEAQCQGAEEGQAGGRW